MRRSESAVITRLSKTYPTAIWMLRIAPMATQSLPALQGSLSQVGTVKLRMILSDDWRLQQRTGRWGASHDRDQFRNARKPQESTHEVLLPRSGKRAMQDATATHHVKSQAQHARTHSDPGASL